MIWGVFGFRGFGCGVFFLLAGYFGVGSWLYLCLVVGLYVGGEASRLGGSVVFGRFCRLFSGVQWCFFYRFLFSYCVLWLILLSFVWEIRFSNI